MMIDAFDNSDSALYQALAGGVTTAMNFEGGVQRKGVVQVAVNFS